MGYGNQLFPNEAVVSQLPLKVSTHTIQWWVKLLYIYVDFVWGSGTKLGGFMSFLLPPLSEVHRVPKGKMFQKAAPLYGAVLTEKLSAKAGSQVHRSASSLSSYQDWGNYTAWFFTLTWIRGKGENEMTYFFLSFKCLNAKSVSKQNKIKRTWLPNRWREGELGKQLWFWMISALCTHYFKAQIIFSWRLTQTGTFPTLFPKAVCL